jgi:hypothetical protein
MFLLDILSVFLDTHAIQFGPGAEGASARGHPGAEAALPMGLQGYAGGEEGCHGCEGKPPLQASGT